MMPGVTMVTDAYSAAKDADVVVIVTEWDAYRALDLAKLNAVMKGDVLVDLRNIYRPEEGARAGFDYYSVGR